jgi:3-oxoadipate enol-lactonase
MTDAARTAPRDTSADPESPDPTSPDPTSPGRESPDPESPDPASADSEAGAAEQTSIVRGARIAWSEAGSGPLAIYAHGLTQSRASETASGMFDWSPVARAGHRLVRYDARGHGRSSGSPDPSQYSWANLAQDLLALADQLSPDAPVSGIGSSMGTGTMLHAAVAAPRRFDRLVLTAPPTAWATRAAQGDMYRAGADLVEQQGPQALAAMAAQAPVPEVFAGLPDFPPAPDVNAELLPWVMRGASSTDLPAENAIAELDLPVLILAWAGDPGHPLSTAERLSTLIAGSRLEVARTTADLRDWGRLSADFLK